jgi:hypothetical protein
MPDSDLVTLEVGERPDTSLTIPSSHKQSASLLSPGLLRALDPGANTPGYFRDVGFSERSNGYSVAGSINGDGFQARVFSEGMNNGPCETGHGF